MFRHSKQTGAVALALVVTLTMPSLSLGEPASPAQPSKTAFVQPDLIRTEATALGSFATRLGDYDANLRRARASKTAAGLPQLKTQADQVKSTSPTALRDLRSAIEKLQRAGKWTPEFDAFVLDRAKSAGTDPRVIAMIQSEGGARALLSSVAAGLPSLPQDVDQDLKAIAPAGIAALPRWAAGETVYAGKGKCAIYVAAGVVLLAIDALPGAGFAFGKAIDCAMTS